MKTVLLFKKRVLNFTSLAILLSVMQTSFAQSSQALVFKNPTLKSGTALRKGAVYVFKDVSTGVDATISIDDLVNGATVKKIDDNSGGLGYTEAFQPEIQTGGSGESYAVFTIRFINAANGNAVIMKSVSATALDIDGNPTVKEFGEVNMNGGNATYMGNTLEILLKNVPIVNSIFNKFRADNILGREKDGIDTTAKGNMFTATKTDVSSFSVKYGATSVTSSNASRQFSMYMMGFQYPNQVTLPLKLISFAGMLHQSSVDLKWTTDAEKNVSHFVIEKGYDGKSFSDAATVFAFGNTSQEKNYNYTDNLGTSKNSVIYYRLRCVDIDGQYTYSEVRVIKLGNTEYMTAVQAYPNPFMNELRITLPQAMQGKELKMELYNASGQMVQLKKAAMASQTEILNTSGIERGFYVIRITAGTEKVQYKVIKN